LKVDNNLRPKVFYGPINIYFGSQTGTASNFAKILGDEAEKQGFEPKIIDLIDFQPETFKTVELAAFLMATHGEGEPTDNAKKFVEWISREDLDGTVLTKMKYTCFGLGNK
jgi:NADPH-ferrihemoprotein reductase